MTEGISQGLFIVVAIVIFGIFVGLSYTLFGDVLSPALENLFNTATDLDTHRLRKTEKRTWLWHTEQIETKQDEILEKLIEKEVGTLYLQVNMDIKPEYYHSFIEKLNNEGIKVQALGGSFDWVSPLDADARWEAQEDFYAWIKKYQETSSSKQKFSGIHLDIEPYANETLWNEDKQNIITYYQQSIEYAVGESNAMNLPLILDVPFWFDNQDYSTDYGDGKLYDWLLESGAEELAIMAFRDKADGEDSILSLTKEEIEKSKSNNVKISISIETQQFDSSENKLSFAEEGETYMMEELVKVKEEANKHKNFSGISVHYLDSWAALGE